MFPQGVDLFAPKFYLDRVVVQSTILGIRKLEILSNPKVKTESPCVSLF